jgi:hypothetical protein
MINKHSNEKTSWEYDSHSASQEIAQMKCKVLYSAHKSSPLVHILRQINPVQFYISAAAK